MPKKTFQVQLSLAERARLQALVTNGSTTAHTHIHARILLKADEGPDGPAWTDAMISSALAVGMSTVARVRQAAVQQGLDAAMQRTLPKRVYQRPLDAAAEAHLVALTCTRHPRAQGARVCTCWPSAWSNWTMSRLFRMKPSVRHSKKRTQAVACRRMVYSPRSKRRVCGVYGRCAGGLHLARP